MSVVASHRPPLRHDALFYDDETFLASAAIAFVREGVEKGEAVMVNTGPNPVTSALRAVFEDSEQVSFADGPVYRTPAVALEAYRRTMDAGLAAGMAGFRAMGFVDLGSSRLPWQEWVRYEAAVNRVFEGYPFHALCPYDAAGVDPVLNAAMRCAHSGVVGHDGRRVNNEYVDPVELVERADLRTPRHPLEETLPAMVVESAADLRDLRMEIYSVTLGTDLPRHKTDDFVAAVGEVVANAHRHAGPPVEVRLWAGPEGVVCTVTDGGPGIADPLAGYARPTDPRQGLGLWAARQLCDLLDWQRTEDGFTVRVATFL